MNSGTIIRTLRERCGLTRQQLATMMGVTYTHIWSWEVGRVCPSTDNFVKFVNSIGYEIVIKPKYRKERDGDETD